VDGPFQASGVWLRCALHAHTTNSDGELPPRFLVRHYASAGFDVLAITDHWVRTEEPSTERLLVLPSTELNARVDDPGLDAHVLALGIETAPERPSDGFPTLAETVAWITDKGGVPYLAHPYWSGLRAESFERCQGLVGVEVWNAGCELEVGRGLSAVHWDDALDAGARLLAIATDDSHHPGFDSAYASTWVRARERSPAAVLAALREGAFYSSSGPEIKELGVDGGTVEVRCSPARRVTLLAGRRRGSCVGTGRLAYTVRGEVLERDGSGAVLAARLALPAGVSYARLEVLDAAGRTAWTNPLWV
jgi:hypothetical protein